MVQLGGYRIQEEVEEVAFLLLAGRNRRPHAFVVALARFASSALRDATIDETLKTIPRTFGGLLIDARIKFRPSLE